MGKISPLLWIAVLLFCANGSHAESAGFPTRQLHNSYYDIKPQLVTPPEARAGGTRIEPIASTDELTGDYVMTYSTLLASGYDGGLCATINSVEGTDSVTITNFWEDGAVVKAKIDTAAMTISIPNQVIGYSSTYGYYDLAAYTSGSGPDRDAQITGSISSDGTVTISSLWGAFILEGDYANYYYGIYSGTVLEPANATMSYDVYESGDTITCSFGVIVEQSSTELVTVKNFYNHGGTLDITLSKDSIPTIAKQLVYTNSTGAWCSYYAEYDDDYTLIQTFGNDITGYAPTDTRTLSWGPWNVICTDDGSVIYEKKWIISGKVVTGFDIAYLSSTEMELEGEGTAESPYLVGSADQWNALATYMYTNCDSLTGKYVRLTADLDFTSTEIKQLGYGREEIFNGDLDGNGKSIKNISVTTTESRSGGVIITAGAGSHIHDLTVEGELSVGHSYSAGVVGCLYGRMTNVVSKVDITSTSTYTAGLAAYAGEGCVLYGCVNEGSITSKSRYLAGLVAESLRGVTYTACGNKGDITYTGTNANANIAGMVYFAYYTTMTDCFNEGNVKATGSSSGQAAGLVNYFYAGSGETNVFCLKGCYNSGDVTSAYLTAGLNATGTADVKLLMEDCYNTGDISSTLTTTKTGGFTAGIASVAYRSSTYSGCWNSGKITSSGPEYTGGLIGSYRSSTSDTSPINIIGCYNIGDVEATSQYVGGIMSYMPQNTYIDSCYNSANISGKAYCGGIAGYAANTVDSVTWCFNTGDVTASGNYVAGIVGYGAATVQNAYNAGTITGTRYVAAIVGRPDAGTTSIERVYNSGKLAPSSTDCGNIIGTGTDNTNFWNESNVMSQAYYLSAYAVECTDTLSTALSFAGLAALELEGWNNGDSCTYPILADNEYAKAYAAAVIPADGDSYDNITGAFYVGTPYDVAWTASSGSVQIDGNNVTFTESFTGTLTMTATCGAAIVATTLTCDVAVDGIDTSGVDQAVVVGERYYNSRGERVQAPAAGLRAIYIVVRTYSDGTLKATKVVM